MDLLTLLPALLFALTGLVAIYVLSMTLLKSLIKDFRFDPISQLRMRKLNRYILQLSKAREYFEAKDIEKTAEAIRAAFFINPPLVNLNFLEAVHDHNFDILAFVLYINQDLPGQLQPLPELERLLQNRMQLMRSLAESYLSLELMKKKRSSEGKKTPDWAVTEFLKKIEGLVKDLGVNRKETEKAIDLLCTAIVATAKDGRQLTYH